MLNLARHGVMAPNRRPVPAPARAINAKSRKKEAASRIRLDKLLRSANPQICIKRRLGGIGDVLMTTPITKAIKDLIPRCRLTYATDLKYSNGALGDIIRHNPYVDELIAADHVPEEKYDYVVDITTTGLDKERAGTVPPNRIDLFAAAVGVEVSSCPLPVYEVTADEHSWAAKYIRDTIPDYNPNNIKLIAIQARSNDARRTWPLEHTEALAFLLGGEKDIHIFLMDWGHTVPRWKAELPNVHLFMDRPITEVAALVQQCDIIVCPDSAILHLAGALQKKIVTIFGPIPPASRINYYANATAVTKNLPCQYCITGDSYILSAGGYKDIQSVQTGEKVYTANGQLEKVVQVHKNDLGVRKLRDLIVFSSNEPITVTEDHKLLIAQRKYSWKNKDWSKTGNRRGIPSLSIPEWKEAKNIKTGDYCCIPRSKISTNSTHQLLQDGDLAWLVGLFVAEGWTSIPHKASREYKATLAVGSSETQSLLARIKKIVKQHKSIFYSGKYNSGFVSCGPNSKGQSDLIDISNKAFVELLHDLFGVKAGETINSASKKHIPYTLLSSPNEIVEGFLLGLQQGDGYDGGQDIVYSTSSRELAYGVQLLCCKLGCLPKVYRRTRDTDYKQEATIYRIYRSKEQNYKRWYIDDKYIYVPVKSNKISSRQDNVVYDITVANDPTFTIQNIAAFDCWYSPKCIKGSDNNKLDCLTRIMPQEVKEAIMGKLLEPYKVSTDITYGKTLTDKNQDSVIMIRRSTAGLGDLLMATPAIEAMAKMYPEMQIEVACKKELWPVLLNNPHVDKIMDCDEPYNPRRYYMIADISAPCARYESARVNSGKAVQKSRVEIYAEACGVRELLTDLKPRYYMTQEESDWAADFISRVHIRPGKPLLAVGMRSAEQYRDWPEDGLKDLFAKLEPHANIILLDHSRKHTYPNVIDAAGFELRKAIAILSKCNYLLSVDTSLIHFAAALDIPVVAAFGPIDYKSRCKGYKNITIIKSDLPCISCWRNSKIACRATGLIQGYSKCMSNIRPDQMAKVVIDKLKTFGA